MAGKTIPGDLTAIQRLAIRCTARVVSERALRRG
jgi:hypothetical protein